MKLELEHDCAGICSPSEYFVFSDVKRGKPDGDCLKGLQKHVRQNVDFMVSCAQAILVVTGVIQATVCLSLIYTCVSGQGMSVREPRSKKESEISKLEKDFSDIGYK